MGFAQQKLTPVPLADVKLSDGFWADKLKTNHAVTVWHNFRMCEETGRIGNFEKAAGTLKGDHEGAFFNDSDVYKVIEGAAYILADQPDEKLDRYLDDLIGKIATAQRPDGYLYTFYQLKGMDKRFTNLKEMHELYCAGHLIEAGVAHFRATGKRSLLNVASRLADHIDATFGPEKRHEVCGHEEIELALFKLAAATDQPRYRKLGEFFVAERGRRDGRALYGEYFQDVKPVEDLDHVMGHAVRQTYLLCAMTDVVSVGDQKYRGALDRLWNDLTQRKMYITGGVGARHEGESFGEPYELPNESAYAETCAAIGNARWNHRMNLLTGEAKYADVVEQVSYNGMLSGVSLSGDKFFYVNPLASKGTHHRQPWFDCACCPPNVVRFIASLPSRACATSGDAIYVNLYAAGESSVEVAGQKVRLRQETRYPWDGKVELIVTPQKPATFTVRFRIPGWCEGVTGIQINSDEVIKPKPFGGYAEIRREWKPGDTIEFGMPMPIRRVHADPRVKANLGRVALARGPIVYCAEAVDNNGHVNNLFLAPDARLVTEDRPDLLGGVTVIKGKAMSADAGASPHEVDFTAVPYFAWDNRAAGEMAVWLPEDASLANAVAQ